MAKGTGRRDLKKEAFWQRTIDQQTGSGRSVRAWCRQHGLSEANFHWWRRELARRDAEGHISSCRAFVPVHVTPGNGVHVFPEADPRAPETGGQIEIVLAKGCCVRVAGVVDRQMLADVLAILTPTDSLDRELPTC
jgi:transposase-like protein